MTDLGKTLVFMGIGLVLIGLGVLVVQRLGWLGLGRLPGDIRIERENFTFYFPLATCLLLSAALTVVLWVIGWIAHGKR